MHTSTQPVRPPTAAALAAMAAALLAAASLLATAAVSRPPAAHAAEDTAATGTAAPIRTWRLPATPAFEPLDVAILPDGRLAVADARTRAVRYYDRDGQAAGMERARDREVPVAVASDPGDGSWVVAWYYVRSRPSVDPLEGAKAADRGTYARILRHRAIGADVSEIAHLTNLPVGDIAVRMLDSHVVVHPWRYLNHALIMPSGIPATTPGRPRIAAWRNNWVGFTEANGRPFEVYEAAAATTGYPTAALRKAITFTGEVAIAVASSEPLRFHVLTRPAAPSGGAAAAPIVRIVGADLTEIDHVRLDGAPVPPASQWPWAIDVGADGDFAVTTAGEVFQVIRYDAAGRERHRLYGGRPRDRFGGPSYTYEQQGSSPAALAIADDGPLVVADHGAVDLLGLAPDGAVAPWRRGTWARDVAVAGGAVFAADDDGAVRRFDAPGQRDPAWTARTGPAGPIRLAAAGGRVYAAQPLSGTIAVLDAATGGAVGRLDTAAAGVDATDIAATADGAVYALDAARGALAAFAPDGALSATWPVGIAAPPRYLAVADTPRGRVAAVVTDGGEVERYDLPSGRLIDQWQGADAEGAAYVPSDVALGADGTLYLAQRAAGAVHAYPPEPVAAPPPAATPPATPGPRSCRVTGTKGAAPGRVVLGETVVVSITLRAACPDASRFQGADVLFVVDRSGSMAPHDKLVTGQAVAARLAHAFRDGAHRTGLVTFAADARLDAPLGGAAAVVEALHGLAADGSTDLAGALELARATLVADRRADALPLVVIVSDGRSDTRIDPAAFAEAGILVASVVVGGDADQQVLRQAASSTDLVFLAADAGAAQAIHRRLLTAVYGTVAGDWAIDDALGQQVALVDRSVNPPAALSDDVLRWARPILPPGGITLTYRVRPLTTGRLPTNRFAYADYTDADGARRRTILPVPYVEVIAPTPTPTPEATATPTATPTPVPRPIYLPLAIRERCRGATRPIDAVLVIDASSSMLERAADGRTKLAAAQAAVGPFLDALRLAQNDRAAVVAFHQSAAVVAPLTGDRDRLDRALAAIRTDRQTCLVCGVDAAAQILEAVPGRAGRQAVIVVLTDGRSNPRPASEAVARAAVAKAADIAIFTIGLGADLDVDALTAMASSPRAFFRTVDAAALESIYRDIARELPCPPGSFWGRR